MSFKMALHRLAGRCRAGARRSQICSANSLRLALAESVLVVRVVPVIVAIIALQDAQHIANRAREVLPAAFRW